MAKLYIPKDCVLEGNLSRISCHGDIVIENGINPSVVTSEAGGIIFRGEADALRFEQISAATGVSFRGKTVAVGTMSAEEGEIEGDDFQCNEMTFSNHLAFKAGTLRLQTLRAKSAVIEADRIEIDELVIEEDLILRGREVHVVQCSAGKIQLSGQYQGERMTAIDGVHQEQGSITVRFLDTRTYSAEDHVRGMVAISTAEDVRAVGVRGFLRPDEFNILSGNNPGAMEPSISKPMPMEPLTASTDDFSGPTMPEDGGGEWLVEAEPVVKDPEILHHPNDPDQVDTRSMPTGELELVAADEENAFIPTHEFVPPEPMPSVPNVVEDEGDATLEGEDDDFEEGDDAAFAGVTPSHEEVAAAEQGFATNPAVEEQDMVGIETEPSHDDAQWKSVEELPESIEATAEAAEAMRDVAASSFDGEESMIDDAAVQEINNEELAAFDADFDDPELPQTFDVQEVADESPVPVEENQAFEEPTVVGYEDEALHADISADDISADDISSDDIAADDISSHDISADDIAVSEPEPVVSTDEVVREVVSDIRADDLMDNDISAEDLQGDTGEFGQDFTPSTDIDAESLSEMNDYMTMTGEDDEFEAKSAPEFGDIAAAGDPEDFQSVPEFGNTTDLDEMAGHDVTADDLTSQPDPFPSQPEIHENGDELDDANNSVDGLGAGNSLNEDVLAEQLNGILDQICAFFPEKNYPKFVGQIQRYVDERRFMILAKERNKEAVLSRIDKMEHEEISRLARSFYSSLAEALQN